MPAYAFPTPEVVWLVGGILLKPALIFFPILLIFWRIFEWRLKWVHVRAYKNRRVASLVALVGLIAVVDFIDRLSFYEEPPTVSKTGRPLTGGTQLSLEEFEQLLQEGDDRIQIVDLRSEDAFKAWHIKGSVNMPDANRDEVQTLLENNLAPVNLVICYGGERSRSMAGYLRTHFESTPIHSVYKGVFQLKLKLSPDTKYIVRNIPPPMANVWLQYGLARHHPEHGLEVLTARGILRPGVVSLPSPPIFMVKAGAFLRQRFGGPWTPWLALLGLNGIVFFALIFQRKQAQRFERTGIPGWLEVTLVSLLTLLVALPAMTFPEFYGTTAQEYPVLGETQFSRLLILYTLLWDCR